LSVAGTLYLDDLAVGQKYETAAVHVVLEGATAFAARFDPQPMRLLVEGELDIAGGLVGLGGEIKWPRPTYPGDTLRVVSEVLAIRVSESKPDRGIVVTVRNETLNQYGEQVQVAVVKMLVPRRPA
jgi:acyl dehydratase